MITEKNTSPRTAFRSAPKTVEQDASLENASCSDSKEEQAVLSGVKPVLELLEREPERIDAVLVRKGKRSQDTDRILDLCRTAKVRFTLADAQSLDRLCPAGHQGVVARLFEAGFTEFADLLTDATDAPLPLILVLDQVQDPGNAGTLARTLYAMGGAGLVIPRHNGTFLGAGARRAAAGALERLPVAKVMNISRALDEARDAGFLIYGAAFGEGSLDAFTTRLHTPAGCQTLPPSPAHPHAADIRFAQCGAGGRHPDKLLRPPASRKKSVRRIAMTSEYSIPVREIPIATLGQAKIPSPLPYGNMINTGKVMLSLSHEYDEDIDTHQTLLFEEAGPRQELYFDPGKTKCAIVTCGGLCPGLNDVIRAIVLEAYHAYNTPSVLGIRYGLEGFIPSYSHNVMELTPASVEHIYQFGGTLLGSSRGPQAPSEIVDALERLNVSVLFVIGGDGSMKAASAIAKEVRQRNIRISIIGIPKTIDNDINFVPQSFGFDTAVDKATEAIGCAHVEAVGTPNGIGIVKLMGRESGFIAAQSALALREANFVLIPEAPFQLHGDGGLLPALERRLKLRGHAVIIAAEGAGQHLLQQNEARDASGNPVLSDVGSLLRTSIVDYFHGKMPISIKYIDPSYIIRSVPANANDRVYCGFLGQHAVHAAMAGRTEMVVAKIMDRYVHIPLDLVTKKRRKLDIRSGLWRAVLESTGQGELTGMLPEGEKA